MPRPKGSKNKPKDTQTKEIVKTPTKRKKVEKPRKAKEEPPKHVMFTFVDYVIERMDGYESDYYKRYAKRMNATLHYAIAKSIIDLFKLHDLQLDSLLKLSQKEPS